MSNEKNKIVPKLRFPEFESSEEWDQKIFEDVAIFLKGKGISKSDIDNNGIQPCIRYGELYTQYTEIIKSTVSYTNLSRNDLILSEEKDVIIPSSGETRDDIASASCVMEAGIALGGDLNIIRSQLDGAFLSYYLTHVKKKSIAKLAQGDAVVHLYSNQLKKLEIHFPKLKDEQQKIADCLSSLDDLITAQGQKIDSLQKHKKGLMQQLFPAEGETVPKLRFAEFNDCGEWEEKELGGIVEKVGSGITPLGGETNYIKTGRPFVRSQNVGWGVFLLDDIVFIDERLHQNSISTEIKSEDVLLNITGASIGRSAVADHRTDGGNVNQHVCIIRTVKRKLNPFFLNQYLISVYGQKQIDSFQAGGNRQGLNFAQIRSFSIPIPPTPEEQQKIAEFLSSMDRLINAQTERVEAFKAHKKGLVQQLFPAINELTPAHAYGEFSNKTC